MALNILKQPFIRLSYAQGATTYFYDDSNSTYYRLLATTASNAYFEVVIPVPTDGNVIPNSATVFVTFQDNSTVIINDFNFYGKPGSSSSYSTIKLLSNLPDYSYNNPEFSTGDVVGVIQSEYGGVVNHSFALCTNVAMDDDSGRTIYTYTWNKFLEGKGTDKSLKIFSTLPSDVRSGYDFDIGDTIGVTSFHNDNGTPVFDGFKIYVCTGIRYDYPPCGSGTIKYFTWTEVYTYPQTTNEN